SRIAKRSPNVFTCSTFHATAQHCIGLSGTNLLGDYVPPHSCPSGSRSSRYPCLGKEVEYQKDRSTAQCGDHLKLRQEPVVRRNQFLLLSGAITASLVKRTETLPAIQADHSGFVASAPTCF